MSNLMPCYKKAMSEYGIVVGAKKYWISKDTTVDDILSCSAVKVRRYWIARLSDDNHWDYALDGTTCGLCNSDTTFKEIT